MYLILCLLFGPAIQLSSSELIYSQLQDDLLSHELPYTASISPDFAHFSLVQPSYLHSRTKRQISTTKLDQDTNEHINHLTVKYSINNTLYTLDLILNRELLPASYFEKHQKDGAHVIRNRTNTKDVELCHYKGVLRDVPGSWAAISTCDNILRGVVYDGTELNYIEPLYDETVNSINSNHTNLSQHIVYKQSDFLSHDKHQCGYKSLHNITRTKRDTVSKHDEIRGPYNANIKSRYLELVIVVDNRLYNLFNKNSKLVHRHCKDISNVINALYEKLNIFIALVGVVVWTEYDEITLNVNGDITLTNFLSYRKDRLVLSHPNDNAQLLTGMTFSDGVVGKALKGPICTYEFSGGVNVDHKNVVGLVATTVAHEMGHNLGMEHDTTECTCPSDRCIMAPSSSSVSPTEWSSCSLEYLALSFDHGMDYCMRNKPKALFDSPVCGNGFVEDGEECDCGLEDSCKNACCNATTCMLKVNATCATGSCCNLETCQPHTAGRQCRAADRECDLPEFCTGDSEFCPSDVFKMDGETCKGGEAFCYEGSCRTHSDQCLLLWGPSASSSDKRCFDLNTSGNRRGNCGYYKPNMTYAKCEEEDVLCGMLHCQHLSEKLEYGIETVAILSHSFLNPGGFIIPCRSAIVDLGLNQVDPGLSPDGARCGDGKLCVNRKCMSVAALRASMPVADCPFNCHDQGVCNSRGHCHCHPGFAPPYCEYPGVGGSVDSGPASDPNESRLLITLFYVILVAVLPLSALILFLKYYNNHPKSFWWKRPFDTRQVTVLSNHSNGSNLKGVEVLGKGPSLKGAEQASNPNLKGALGRTTLEVNLSSSIRTSNPNLNGVKEPSSISVPLSCIDCKASSNSVKSCNGKVSCNSVKSCNCKFNSYTNLFSRLSSYFRPSSEKSPIGKTEGKQKFTIQHLGLNGDKGEDSVGRLDKIMISDPIPRLDRKIDGTNAQSDRKMEILGKGAVVTRVSKGSKINSTSQGDQMSLKNTSNEVKKQTKPTENDGTTELVINVTKNTPNSGKGEINGTERTGHVRKSGLVTEKGPTKVPHYSIPKKLNKTSNDKVGKIANEINKNPRINPGNSINGNPKNTNTNVGKISESLQQALSARFENNATAEDEVGTSEPLYESIDIDVDNACDNVNNNRVHIESIETLPEDYYSSDSFDSDGSDVYEETGIYETIDNDGVPQGCMLGPTSLGGDVGPDKQDQRYNNAHGFIKNHNSNQNSSNSIPNAQNTSNNLHRHESNATTLAKQLIKARGALKDNIVKQVGKIHDRIPYSRTLDRQKSNIGSESSKGSNTIGDRPKRSPRVTRETLSQDIVKQDLVSTTNNRVNDYLKSGVWQERYKCNSNALTGHKVAKSTQNHSNSTSGGRGQRLLSSGEGQNYNILAAKTHKSSDMNVNVPTRAAPVKPPKVPSDAQITPIRAAPKIPATSVRLSADFANFSATLPPELPPANKGPNTSPYARPLISSPVLSDTTSQTVRELIDAKNAESTRQTTRPASIAKSSTLPPVATESNALPGSTLHPVSSESNAPKGSTLNRITSFMSRNSTRRNSKVLTPPNTQGSARSLEISEPIPLNNLRDNEDKVDMIKRTQSMRETDVNFKRPNLPAFGSMRAKRPTSLAGSQRPSQPPPPAPSGIQSLPGYQNPAGQAKTPSGIQSLPGYQNPSAGQGKTPGTPVQGPGQGLLSPAQGLLGYQNPVAPPAKPKTYDDCLNLLSESMAALANVDHNPNDNIYAVIEESPATSDLGLLGEIVSEIQARNTESIYSSQSLMDTNKLYMNTRDLDNVSPDPTIKSTTSSGYLSPIGITDTNNFSRSSINKDTSSVNNTSNNNRSINKDTSHLNNRSIKDTPPSSINRTESISRPPESIHIDPSSYRSTHGSSSSVPSSVPSSSFSKPVNSSVNTFSSKPSVNVNSSVNNFSSKPSVNTSFNPSVNSPSNPANSFSSKPSVHSSANSSLSSPNVSSLHKPTSARPTSLVGLKVSSNAPTVPTSSQSGTKSKPSIKSSLADASKSMTKTSDIKSPTAKTESVTQPATKDSIIPKSGVNSAPKSGAKVNEVPKTGAASSYKPFSASRGPLSGNTVSSYTAKPVKPTVPQRPTSVVPGLKRPDLISSCSTGGNVATSPDVVNKPRSSVASLQQKFENL
ncbi:hypothetical protein M8J77_000812 [Diaphorina citri]|nr:hypothetical protein M8J77_000812 [Diaphorina citri]